MSTLNDQLARVCEDLNYISEIDAPVLPIDSRKALFPDHAPEIRRTHFGAFFEKLTCQKDWHSERERYRIKKFLELKRLLEENLSDLEVIRVGVTKVDIYVVGRDLYGHLAGVRTTAVET